MTIYIASTGCRFDGNYIEQFENRSHLYEYAVVDLELGNFLTPRSTIADICHELAQRRAASHVSRVTRQEAIELFRWSLPKMFPASNHPKYYAKNRIEFELAGFPQYVWA